MRWHLVRSIHDNSNESCILCVVVAPVWVKFLKKYQCRRNEVLLRNIYIYIITVHNMPDASLLADDVVLQ